MAARFTNKAYTVRTVLDFKRLKGVGLIYWVRIDCRVTRWAIGRTFKTVGNVIPPGTPYFGDYDSAYAAWQRQ
ncbi:MAG: hypothetical protein KAS66_00150 [Candidatus Omnitrophica bacterium]|nr:hypothetical protein [Candidatus Omnitrophota bacterium]